MNILKQKRQIGISLIEIMVAMVISIFLLGGVIQVYIGNKTSYRFADASARIQENARFALETMASDIRMTGFWGCAQFFGNEEDKKRLVNNLNFTNAQKPLYDYIENAAISATENLGLNGSDSITILGSKAGQNTIRAAMANSTDDIIIDSRTNIEEDDIVIVSDCDGADIFEVSSMTAIANGRVAIAHKTGGGNVGNIIPASTDCTPAGTNHCLSKLYGSLASISALQTVTYSIQQGSSGEPALFRSLNGTDEELIEGIEELQVLFGIDNTGNGQPNRYVTSDNVVDPSRIGALRLFLVVRSDNDQITDNKQFYNLNGVAKTAPDNRLRQIFSMTVTLRNRT